MATKIENTRVFKHGDKELKDINPKLSPEEVLDVYVEQYPDLVNAKVTGPKLKDNKAIYEFEKIVGTKG